MEEIQSAVNKETQASAMQLDSHQKTGDSLDIPLKAVREKISVSQTSKLLFLTVEYVENGSNKEQELINHACNMAKEVVHPFDASLGGNGFYDNIIQASSHGQMNLQNSILLLPESRNHSQSIDLVIDGSLPSAPSVLEEMNYVVQSTTTLQPKLISPCLLHKAPEENAYLSNASLCEIDVSQNPAIEIDNTYQSVTSYRDACKYSIDDDDDDGIKGEKMDKKKEEGKNCDAYDYSTSICESLRRRGHGNVGDINKKMGEDSTAQQGFLLSHPDQGNDEEDSFSLNQGDFSGAGDSSEAYAEVENHLDMSADVKKAENEYLMPATLEFEYADINLLQSNLEVFPSQGLDTNELLLFDRNRSSQSKRQFFDHFSLDNWCENCELGLKCSRHEIKIISDKPVLSRARASLPKELLAINKLSADSIEEGVFARKTIMRRVQFGPVEGRLLSSWDEKSNIDEVTLVLEVETGQLLKLDVSDEHQTNWMRFVRRAKNFKEQNLILTQQGKSLYFTTTRVIPPRHELKVGYSPHYAQRRKLRVAEEATLDGLNAAVRLPLSEDFQENLIHDKMSPVKMDVGTNKTRSEGVKKSFPMFKEVKEKQSDAAGASIRENECRTCHKIFPRSYSLRRHISMVHPANNKENSRLVKNTSDNKCDKTAAAAAAAVVANNTLFKKKSFAGTGSEWLCTHCNLTFDNASILNLHTLTHAAEDLESEAVLSLPPELSFVYRDEEFLIENGDVQCPQCTREFPSKKELIDHVSTHGKITLKKCFRKSLKAHKCDQCYKSFASDARLKRHMLVHGCEDNKPFRCDTCFKRFLNNSALSCHLKIHSGKKCFDCPICNKEFSHVFGLREHVKIHSADGFFNCPHCSKVFDGYSVVRKHIRAFHSGHRHVCKDCGKLCLTLDKLRMHSLKHSDHREFLCANCGKQFKRKDKLKEHMKRMHSAERESKAIASGLRASNSKDKRFAPKMSPTAYDRFVYKCRNCMIGFKRRGMFVNHLAKRHPDIIPDTVPELNWPIMKATTDYFCQYCDKIYKSSSKRKVHILKNHPGAELPMSNRQKGGIPFVPGTPNPTFSQTVGSVKMTPHPCKWCHKQYASKAKLLQHQRKKHVSLLPKSQQVPRSAKNPSSPLTSESERSRVGFRTTDSGHEKTDFIGQLMITRRDRIQRFDENGNNRQVKLQGQVFEDNGSNDVLLQTMTATSTSQSLSPERRESQEGKAADARAVRTWPDSPPHPPL